MVLHDVITKPTSEPYKNSHSNCSALDWWHVWTRPVGCNVWLIPYQATREHDIQLKFTNTGHGKYLRLTTMEGSREDVSQLLSSLRKIDSDKITERKVCTICKVHNTYLVIHNQFCHDTVFMNCTYISVIHLIACSGKTASVAVIQRAETLHWPVLWWTN